MRVDVLIVGGGIAGLWTLDELVRAGYACVLVEREALGQGQSIWSQGIIHSGLKYTLEGAMTGSAKAIREAPGIWLERLAGRGEPNLSGATIRSPHCWMWRSGGLGGFVGMMGARRGLRVAPKAVEGAERPAILARCRGTVAKVGEPVVDVGSVLGVLRWRHEHRLIRGDVRLDRSGDEVVGRIGDIEIGARAVVLSAGNGARPLREQLGLAAAAMQVRDLHMVMVRGTDLPELHGHCVDYNHTRITVTSGRDAAGRVVWVVGGELAERGAGLDRAALIAHAQREIAESIPGIDLAGVEWATYHAPRAEGKTKTGRRPDGPVVKREGNVLSVWPTKLALAPMAADLVVEACRDLIQPATDAEAPLTGVVRPGVARDPWDEDGVAWSGPS